MAKAPGQTSFAVLVVSSFWTVFMLLVMIGGHLLMLLWAWEVVFEHAGLQELAELLHAPADVLLGIMAMAIISDIWGHFGAKKSLDDRIDKVRKRRR